MPIPFPDAVQEFSVQTTGLPAQYGLHPGGVVNIVTKSGANALHGDAFDFLRNGDLNARPKGVAGLQTPRDSLKRNQFGGVAGGRIIKDKLFFFGGYQETRQRSDPASQTAYTTLPPPRLPATSSYVDRNKSTTRPDGLCLAAHETRLLEEIPTAGAGAVYPNNQIPQEPFSTPLPG